ncbi:PGF-pre-PGF domain-containing protein [Methanosarcina sp. DH1]|uniref:PGF-pre-PGF domain-containing protein n=1 Tax=Methanosarcina sp. DH1 TaxID=2605695 RepID=UPI001E5EF2AE|nr:PGF-pre-PGF domain-containing protein [Methanosarcina sp. DH1]MCC4765588.1 PGF-pre-PGF domain-containing protein [Methanosarcina sp. DH1]
MKINKHQLIAILLVAILIAFIPLASAAPAGTSESTVVAAAKSWIGVKSVHGGNSRSGIDCSHLVYQVYKQAGAKDIVFQTVPNMKKNAYYVTTDSPTPGDVIFWKKDITENNRTYWLISHVGIYIGNGQFIDTSFDTKTVTTESISGVYQEGLPYYARWDPGGSDDTDNDETPDDNDVNTPVAAFSMSTTSGQAPLNVVFTDQSTDATSWSWSFGDGSTSSEKNPNHTYSEAGDYTVVLTVNNEKGSSSDTQKVVVQSEPTPEIILPVADFDADNTSGSAPLSVQFTDLSQNANGWDWNFGDGDTSTEQSPAYTYGSAGNYTVVLTANNENGSSSKSLNITVEEEPGQEEILPVADFDADTTSGSAPLSVQFTDLSQNANEWYWNFGDGTNSTEQNPMHTYSSPGNYDVNLTVVNENKTASEINTINVLEESNSSDSNSDSDSNSESDSDSDSDSGSSSGGHSHKSGSSSGGVGGSPEPAKNVQVKEVLQTFIASGRDVDFNFTNNATCVESITFRSTKTVGKTTTIVEELKNKSSLVSELPEGIVYKSFNIWVGNGGYGTSKNIESPSVNFKVNTSWVDENNINRSSIILDWYDDEKKEWTELPVSLTGEDDQFLYFTANVPGYSSFAITGTKNEGNTIAAEPAQKATNNTTGSNAGINAINSTSSNASNNVSSNVSINASINSISSTISNAINSTISNAINSTISNAINSTISHVISSTGSNASTIENKVAEVSKSIPGFSMISGIVCLLCVFLYRNKGK